MISENLFIWKKHTQWECMGVAEIKCGGTAGTHWAWRGRIGGGDGNLPLDTKLATLSLFFGTHASCVLLCDQ